MQEGRNYLVGLAVVLMCGALLSACGGGGGGGSSPPNGLPFAPNAYFVTSPDTSITGTLYASSIASGPITFKITKQPVDGTVSLSSASSGSFTYQPKSGFTGTDTFTFVAVNVNGQSDPATATIVVNSKPPTVSAFGTDIYVYSGGPTVAQVTFRLSNPANGNATVNYTTENGTAKAGTDYTSESGTITFGAGVTSQTINIPLTDATGTSARYFQVALSGASSNLTTGQSTATVFLRYVSQPLNDTGITGCTTATNFNPSNPDSCPQSTYPGQDADYGRDPASEAGSLKKVGSGIFGYDFTKIGNNGKPLFNQNANYSLDPWACLRDNWTGLEWEVPTPVVDAGLFDSSYEYTWYDPNSSSNGGSPGTPNGGPNQLDTYHYVQRVNQVGLCGHHDWHLPTAAELRNLINFGAAGVPSSGAGLPSLPTFEAAGYWTSTPAPNSSRALLISSEYAYGSFVDKSTPGYVILVRGGAS